MASNVASTAGFTSANMKPVSGEQLDAVWGQNIADNTGYLRQRPSYFINGYGTHGTQDDSTSSEINITFTHNVHFARWPGHNYLCGTMVGSGTFTDTGAPDAVATHGFYIYGDLGTYGGTTSFATSNIGNDYTYGSTFAFGVDITPYVSAGSFATLTWYFSGTLRDFTGSNFANYSYGTPCKAFTTWVG